MSLFIRQLQVTGPTEDETDLLLQRTADPGSTGEAPVPDMDHLLAPLLGALAEQLGFFSPLVAMQRALVGPPTHGR